MIHRTVKKILERIDYSRFCICVLPTVCLDFLSQQGLSFHNNLVTPHPLINHPEVILNFFAFWKIQNTEICIFHQFLHNVEILEQYRFLRFAHCSATWCKWYELQEFLLPISLLLIISLDRS